MTTGITLHPQTGMDLIWLEVSSGCYPCILILSVAYLTSFFLMTVACADDSNGVGIRGVLGDCKKNFQLLIAKTFQGPSTKMSLVEQGVEWCMTEGADVISLSLASQSPSFNSLMIFRYIKMSGKAIVLAANGNGGRRMRKAYPAGYPDVTAVGAIDKYLKVPSFSQLNPDIVAPGVSIISHSADYSVSVENIVGEAQPMIFTASLDRSVSGPLCDCGQKSAPCTCPEPSICVVQRNEQPVTTVSDSVLGQREQPS